MLTRHLELEGSDGFEALRDISSSLDVLLPVSSKLLETFSSLLQLCAAISVVEDFLVLQLGARAALRAVPETGESWAE